MSLILVFINILQSPYKFATNKFYKFTLCSFSITHVYIIELFSIKHNNYKNLFLKYILKMPISLLLGM